MSIELQATVSAGVHTDIKKDEAKKETEESGVPQEEEVAPGYYKFDLQRFGWLSQDNSHSVGKLAAVLAFVSALLYVIALASSTWITFDAPANKYYFAPGYQNNTALNKPVQNILGLFQLCGTSCHNINHYCQAQDPRLAVQFYYKLQPCDAFRATQCFAIMATMLAVMAFPTHVSSIQNMGGSSKLGAAFFSALSAACAVVSWPVFLSQSSSFADHQSNVQAGYSIHVFIAAWVLSLASIVFALLGNGRLGTAKHSKTQ